MYKVTYKHPVLDARVEITYPLHLDLDDLELDVDFWGEDWKMVELKEVSDMKIVGKPSVPEVMDELDGDAV